MRAEVASAVAAFAGGTRMNVRARCRELGISPKTFYKYVGRFGERGVAGLYPDSRRPHASPGRLPAELDDVLIAVRKELVGSGWDYGATAVLMHLEEHPENWPQAIALPSRSTVNRVLDARGQLATVPKRRPRRRSRRFQRTQVNALWQFDGFEHRLADGTKVVVLHLTDDCSRVDLALDAAVSENGTAIWATFCRAVARYGLPVQILTDNGTGFSGQRRGWTSAFEQQLADLDVQAISSSVGHPQTCGKNERAHQRVQKWLSRRPPASDLDELQSLLDQYRNGFNNRRNMVLDKLTPHQRFDLGPLAAPDSTVEPVTHITQHTVSRTGSIGLNATLIGLGRRYTGMTATAFRNGDHVTVFIGDKHARDLIIDHRRHYQPQNR